MANKHCRKFATHNDYENALYNGSLEKHNISYCKSQKECHFDKDLLNGYEYVDLGLPSGTLWAKYNIGSNDINDPGMYFQWGDIQGYYSNEIGSGEGQKMFSNDWSDYKYATGSSYNDITKYTKTSSEQQLTVLELEDDGALANMGGIWRMASGNDFSELNDYTTRQIVNINNISLIKLTSTINNNELYFCPNGHAINGTITSSSAALVWSNTLSHYSAWIAYPFTISQDQITSYASNRYIGLPIRAITKY